MVTSYAPMPRGILHPERGEKNYRLQRHLPSDDLRFFIEHYWSVQWDVREPRVQETLPHPSVHCVVEKGNSRILGIVTGKFTRVLEGSGWVFGIKFRPGAFYPFVKFPVSRITGKQLTLEKVFPSTGGAFEHEMLALNDEIKKIACAEDFLRSCLPAKDETVEFIHRIVERMMNDKSIVNVDQIADAFSVNMRRLQRLFMRYVGVGPKWIIMRYRLHEAVAHLNEGPAADLVHLALDLGYYDQAHFIKDFKRIVGMTPAAYAHISHGEGKNR